MSTDTPAPTSATFTRDELCLLHSAMSWRSGPTHPADISTKLTLAVFKKIHAAMEPAPKTCSVGDLAFTKCAGPS